MFRQLCLVTLGFLGGQTHLGLHTDRPCLQTWKVSHASQQHLHVPPMPWKQQQHSSNNPHQKCFQRHQQNPSTQINILHQTAPETFQTNIHHEDFHILFCPLHQKPSTPKTFYTGRSTKERFLTQHLHKQPLRQIHLTAIAPHFWNHQKSFTPPALAEARSKSRENIRSFTKKKYIATVERKKTDWSNLETHSNTTIR